MLHLECEQWLLGENDWYNASTRRLPHRWHSLRYRSSCVPILHYWGERYPLVLHAAVETNKGHCRFILRTCFTKPLKGQHYLKKVTFKSCFSSMFYNLHVKKNTLLRLWNLVQEQTLFQTFCVMFFSCHLDDSFFLILNFPHIRTSFFVSTNRKVCSSESSLISKASSVKVHHDVHKELSYII